MGHATHPTRPASNQTETVRFCTRSCHSATLQTQVLNEDMCGYSSSVSSKPLGSCAHRGCGCRKAPGKQEAASWLLGRLQQGSVAAGVRLHRQQLAAAAGRQGGDGLKLLLRRPVECRTAKCYSLKISEFWISEKLLSWRMHACPLLAWLQSTTRWHSGEARPLPRGFCAPPCPPTSCGLLGKGSAQRSTLRRTAMQVLQTAGLNLLSSDHRLGADVLQGSQPWCSSLHSQNCCCAGDAVVHEAQLRPED